MTPAQKLDLLMAEPSEPGALIHFQLGYPDSPKTYDYAAIRTRGGQWYLTGGENSPQGLRWNNLLAWIQNKRATLHAMSVSTSQESLL